MVIDLKEITPQTLAVETRQKLTAGLFAVPREQHALPRRRHPIDRGGIVHIRERLREAVVTAVIDLQLHSSEPQDLSRVGGDPLYVTIAGQKVSDPFGQKRVISPPLGKILPRGGVQDRAFQGDLLRVSLGKAQERAVMVAVRMGEQPGGDHDLSVLSAVVVRQEVIQSIGVRSIATVHQHVPSIL